MPLVAWLLLLRIINALSIRTTFAPDEWWQGPEVAHRLVFGEGHLTWEWAVGLRSYVHPVLFALPYALLKALRADVAWAVIAVPQLVQGCLAALADWFVFRTAHLLFGGGAARWALACQLASWFNAYALVRPYSNSLEACLTVAGVFYWLRQQASSSRGSSSKALAAAKAAADERRWLLLAALCVVFRPSSALFWLLPAALALARTRGSAVRLTLAVRGLAVGAACLAMATLLDRALYGRWVLAPWQFLRFNLLAGGSALYGSHPWHWNASQGAPVVALTLLPLAATGLRAPLPATRMHGRRQLAWLLGWQLLVCSLPAHKEFRFLLPALQLTVPLCGLGATWLTGGASGSGMRREKQLGAGAPGGRPKHWWLPVALLALQLPVALYFCLFHHSANVAVMGALRRLAASRAPDPTSALFLTPCHATPYSTHVHVRADSSSNGSAGRIALRFFDCSPPLWAHAVAALNTADQAWLPLPEGCPGRDGQQQHQEAWRSQRQCFEAEPEGYLGTVLMAAEAKAGVGSSKPTALVGYSQRMGQLTGMLQKHGYRQYKTWANCLLQTDPDTYCGLELWVCEDV